MTKTKNTPVADVSDLTERVTSTTEQLNAANADVALLQRLKDAEANTKRLTRELTDTQRDLATAIADEYAAKQKTAFANIRNMTITASAPADEPNPGLLKMTFTVNYEALSYDYSSRQNLWRSVSAIGIRHLPAKELAYLTEAKPEIIPHLIMELAIGNPAEAVSRYIQGLQRGYLTA